MLRLFCVKKVLMFSEKLVSYRGLSSALFLWIRLCNQYSFICAKRTERWGYKCGNRKFSEEVYPQRKSGFINEISQCISWQELWFFEMIFSCTHISLVISIGGNQLLFREYKAMISVPITECNPINLQFVLFRI